jgi:hypothetical protein
MPLNYDDFFAQQEPDKKQGLDYNEFFGIQETDLEKKKKLVEEQNKAYDFNLTPLEKIAASAPVQTLATAGKTIWDSMAQPYETASLIGDTVNRTVGRLFNPAQPTVLPWEKEPRQKNILDLAAQTMHNKAQDIAPASAPTGSMNDIVTSGLTNAATLGLKMGAMPGLGVPERAIFPVQNALSNLTESSKAGDTPLKQAGKAAEGFAEGFVLDKVLHYIPDKVKDVFKQYALNTAALTAIPEVKNAIERVANGEDPLKIDWKSMVKGLGVTALLPALFGAGGEQSMSKEEIARTNENTWRIEQADIQRAEINKRKELANQMVVKPEEQLAQQTVQESQPTKLESAPDWVNTGRGGQDYYEVTDPNSPLVGSSMNAARLRELGFKVPEIPLEQSKDIQDTPQPTISTEPTIATPKPEAKVIEPKQIINKHSQDLINKLSGDLTEYMGEAATHIGMNVDEQSRMAVEFRNSNPELARKVDADPSLIPRIIGTDGHALKAAAVWFDGKNRAVASGDVDEIIRYAKKSPMQEDISQAAKTLRLLREHSPEDPVYQIMDINKTREQANLKRSMTPQVQAKENERFAKLERELASKTKQSKQKDT